MKDQDQKKLWFAQRDRLTAEIAALRSLLDTEAKKTYAAIRATAEKQLRVELLCTAILKLSALAERGAVTDTDREVVTTTRDLADELLKG